MDVGFPRSRLRPEFTRIRDGLGSGGGMELRWHAAQSVVQQVGPWNQTSSPRPDEDLNNPGPRLDRVLEQRTEGISHV
jgi:hypothetical protein